jgi:predicted DNA-binding transcriptional regulator AlpA
MTPDLLDELRSHPVTDVATVAPLIKRSRAATYRLAASGELPGVRKLGNRYVVVTAELLRWLGLDESNDHAT